MKSDNPAEIDIRGECNLPIASSDAERSDEQDIRTRKAPRVTEPTGHRNRRKRGRPRKSNWMPNPYGNDPRKKTVTVYLDDTRHYYGASTQQVRTRNLIYLVKILKELNLPPNPSNIAKADILKFMDWISAQNIGNARRRKLLGYLRDYLAYYDNGILSTMINNKQIRMPAVVAPAIRSMTRERVHFIHDVARGMDGWEGIVSKFITLAYPYTGLRPSELRTLKYKDMDQIDWMITVSHPKGEGVYGKHREVWVLPPAIQACKEFMAERADYLREHGENVNYEALIPYKSHSGMRYYSDAEFRKLKKHIEDRAGTKFHIKDWRATYCQMCIDMGVKTGQELTTAVSQLMGHRDTRTTETFYGRIRNDSANRKIRDAFKEPDVVEIVAI